MAWGAPRDKNPHASLQGWCAAQPFISLDPKHAELYFEPYGALFSHSTKEVRNISLFLASQAQPGVMFSLHCLNCRADFQEL